MADEKKLHFAVCGTCQGLAVGLAEEGKQEELLTRLQNGEHKGHNLRIGGEFTGGSQGVKPETREMVIASGGVVRYEDIQIR